MDIVIEERIARMRRKVRKDLLQALVRMRLTKCALFLDRLQKLRVLEEKYKKKGYEFLPSSLWVYDNNQLHVITNYDYLT